MRTIFSLFVVFALAVGIALGVPGASQATHDGDCADGHPGHICRPTKTPQPSVTPAKTPRPTETRDRR
jgi:hypothetical protein